MHEEYSPSRRHHHISSFNTIFQSYSTHFTFSLIYNMAYEVEDEVDWSDGTLDEPPSTSTGVSGDSGYVSPVAQEDDGLDYLFEPQEEGDHDLPLGTALPPGTINPLSVVHQLTRIST